MKRTATLLCFVIAAWSMAPHAMAVGNRLHVRAGGTGDGSTWALATGSVQEAIEEMSNRGGGEVWIAAGTYLPDSYPNDGRSGRERHFSLRNGVAVSGGFPATGNPDLAERDPAAFPTVLSGDLGKPEDSSDNAHHVFYHPASSLLDQSARLDGVVIRGANADLTGDHALGGGMFNQSCSPTLLRCRFEENDARSQGGGLYLWRADSQVINCIFTSNRAELGGGVFVYQGKNIFTNCLFTGNRAAEGAALYTYSTGNALIHACTFAGNAARSSGGALYERENSTALSNCILWGNTPDQVSPDSGMTTLDSCIIQGGWGGSGADNLDADPLFAAAADPDGPDNLWGTNDDGLQPTAISPAINRGNNALLPDDDADLDGDSNTTEPLPLDLGNQRRIRGPRPDRGAYETTAPLVYHVRPGGTGNGITWDTSMADPQAAIEACALEGNSQVWIAAGTYLPTSYPNGGTTDREKHFSLRNGVPVYGGFPATGSPTLADRNPWNQATVLSGQNYFYHVLYHPGAAALNATAKLDGVTVTGGNASTNDPTILYNQGGGLLNLDCSPVFSRCDFRGNHAGSGGALYLSGLPPHFVDCVIRDNSGREGGGLYSRNSPAVFANCVFTGNSATQGGGIYATMSAGLTLVNCTLTANSSNTGSVLLNIRATVTLANCIVWGNAPNPYVSTMGSIAGWSCILPADWPSGGAGNIRSDPQFIIASDPDGPDNIWATADDGLRAALPSPAINGGSAALLPADAADIDSDGNTTEPLPLDVIGNPRAIDGIPEIGAYEYAPGAMSLEYWRTLHFSVADRIDPIKQATVWGNFADPDGDHVPNSGEYLLLLNPLANDSPLGQLPIIEMWGVRWLKVVYTVGTDRPEVSLATEYSADLTPASWFNTLDLGFPVRTIGSTANSRTLELLVPAYPPRGFIRMGFSMNP